MIKAYLKIGFRSLWKNRLHSFINVVGLVMGIAVVLLMGSYVVSELQINKDIQDVDRIYVVHSKWEPENLGVFYTTLGPLGRVLEDEYPSLVEDSYRYTIASSTISAKDGRTFREQIQIGDASFIDMFGFELIYGNPQTAFENNSIVISERIAKKYFHRTDVIGEMLTLKTNDGKQVDFQVQGVLATIPTYNSVVNFAGNPAASEIFMSTTGFDYFMEGADESWWFKYMVTLVKLKRGVHSDHLNERLKQIIQAHAPPEFKDSLSFDLAPLKSYYLNWADQKALKMIRTISAIALLIIILVVVNFVGTTISNASQRLKEIGIRKLSGGVRKHIIAQFLIESIITSLLAMIIACVLYILTMPLFDSLLMRSIPSLLSQGLWTLLIVPAFSILLGLLAGLYPAIRLSKFKIVSAVKGKLPSVSEGRFTRKMLLGFQVCITSFVLISSVVISRQLQYIQDYDLGYSYEDVMVISSVPREWNDHGLKRMEAFRNELIKNTEIQDVTLSYEVPDGNAGNQYNFRAANDIQLDMPLLKIDEHFLSTYQIRLVSGHFFHAQTGNYQAKRIVLNESSARAFGWSPQEAIGQEVRTGEDDPPLTIVGVIEDFHFKSLFEAVTPLAFVHLRDGLTYRYLSIKLATSDKSAAIDQIQALWKKQFPSEPFDYDFMDDKLDQFYHSEGRMHKTSKVAGLITILITLLGIIAFLSASLGRRIKEIGIRKVYGARLGDLYTLLVKGFLPEFVVAGIVAGGLAYYFLSTWLSSFEYQIAIPIFFFFITHLSLMALVGILVGAYSLRTLRLNPVEVLKHE